MNCGIEYIKIQLKQVRIKYTSYRIMVECAICLSTEHGADGNQQTLSCGHVFHVHCIEQWMEVNHNCPLCRRMCVFLSKVGSDVETLAKEINTMSGFHIFYESGRPEKCSDEVYRKLQMIKHHLRQYQTIRNNGYSADHLATEIGYLVRDVNIELGALVL